MERDSQKGDHTLIYDKGSRDATAVCTWCSLALNSLWFLFTSLAFIRHKNPESHSLAHVAEKMLQVKTSADFFGLPSSDLDASNLQSPSENLSKLLVQIADSKADLDQGSNYDAWQAKLFSGQTCWHWEQQTATCPGALAQVTWIFQKWNTNIAKPWATPRWEIFLPKPRCCNHEEQALLQHLSWAPKE